MAAKVTPYDKLNPSKGDTIYDDLIGPSTDLLSAAPAPTPASIPQTRRVSQPAAQDYDMETISAPRSGGGVSGASFAREQRYRPAARTPNLSAQAASVAANDLWERKAKRELENYIAGGKVAAEKERKRIVGIFGPEVEAWLPEDLGIFVDENGNFDPVKALKAITMRSQQYYDYAQKKSKDEFEMKKYDSERADKDLAQQQKELSAPHQQRWAAEVHDVVAKNPQLATMTAAQQRRWVASNAGGLTPQGVTPNWEDYLKAAELEQQATSRAQAAGSRAAGDIRNEMNSILQEQQRKQGVFNDADAAVTKAQTAVNSAKTNLNDPYIMPSDRPGYEQALADAQKKLEEAQVARDEAEKKLKVEGLADQILKDGEAVTAIDARAIATKRITETPKPLPKSVYDKDNGSLRPEIKKMITEGKALGEKRTETLKKIKAAGYDIEPLIQSTTK